MSTFGNRVTRVSAPVGVTAFASDFTIRDSGRPDDLPEDRPLTPVKELPSDTLVFLMPSRYCDSDALSSFAWSQFGGIGGGARSSRQFATSSTIASGSTTSSRAPSAPPPAPSTRGSASVATSPISRLRCAGR